MGQDTDDRPFLGKRLEEVVWMVVVESRMERFARWTLLGIARLGFLVLDSRRSVGHRGMDDRRRSPSYR